MGRKAHTTAEHFEREFTPEPMSGCWLWMGEVGRDGYGRKFVNYRSEMAHRRSLELYRGALPGNHLVRHTCGIKLCVNPDHLQLAEALNLPTASALAKRFETAYTPEPNSGCWLWTGKLRSNGYGVIIHDAREIPANRASWLVSHGQLPPVELEACHRCDNRACVNPDHLFLGTGKDNIQDCFRKGRGAVNARRKDGSRPRALKPHEVLEIRAKHAGGVSVKALAEEYGMTRTNMRFIVTRKTWGYLQ